MERLAHLGDDDAALRIAFGARVGPAAAPSHQHIAVIAAGSRCPGKPERQAPHKELHDKSRPRPTPKGRQPNK